MFQIVNSVNIQSHAEYKIDAQRENIYKFHQELCICMGPLLEGGPHIYMFMASKLFI